MHYPFTLEGPTLPSFAFFLDELERAVEGDALYGAEFFERVRPKAVELRNGIEELIYQCIELDAVVSGPASPVDEDGARTPVAIEPPSPVLGAAGEKGMRVKRSRLAKRQRVLEVEGERWMGEMLRRCWEELRPGEEEVKGKGKVVSLDEVVKEMKAGGGALGVLENVLEQERPMVNQAVAAAA